MTTTLPDLSEVDDGVLARRAALGDRQAFGDLFDRHARAVFRFATSMLDGDLDAAQDAVQETFEKAWRALPSYRGEAALRTWLLSITANTVLAARRRRRPVAVDDSLLDARPERHSSDPAVVVQAEQLWQALALALSELPWRQRACWLLKEDEGLTYEQIAQILDTSPTVVRGQLHRARATIAVRMEQWR